MIRTILLLGTNEGDRKNFLDNARMRIALLAGKPLDASSVYEAAAWGKTDQPAFLNQVLLIDTSLNSDLLLSTLLAIENSLGRKRSGKWAPRTIDIDILFYGDQVVNEPNLIIPHPAIAERRFALVPLAEVLPEFPHPVLRKTMTQLLSECPDELAVKKC